MDKIPPIISDDKIVNLVTDYHLSGVKNRHILAKPIAKAQRQSDIKWFIEWLEKRPLISPEEDSITRFYPFRNILQRDIEALKKGLRE